METFEDLINYVESLGIESSTSYANRKGLEAQFGMNCWRYTCDRVHKIWHFDRNSEGELELVYTLVDLDENIVEEKAK